MIYEDLGISCEYWDDGNMPFKNSFLSQIIWRAYKNPVKRSLLDVSYKPACVSFTSMKFGKTKTKNNAKSIHKQNTIIQKEKTDFGKKNKILRRNSLILKKTKKIRNNIKNNLEVLAGSISQEKRTSKELEI